MNEALDYYICIELNSKRQIIVMILQCGRKRIKKPSLPAENVGKKSGRGPMGATIAIETSLPSRRSKEGVSKMGREEIELSRK